MTPIRCAICDQELSIHERVKGDLCSRFECKQIATRVYAQAKTSLKNQQLEVAEVIAEQVSAAESFDQQSRSLVPVVIPSNDNKLQHRTKAERRKFLDRLGSLISQAAAVMAWHSSVVSDDVELEPFDSESPERQFAEVQVTEQTAKAMLSACAFCRGKCCLQGKLHAFLTVKTLLRFMRNNPQLRPREVWQRYVERIPSQSSEGGCIYQSSQGCTLTREMRSSVCNGYECKGLVEVRETAAEDSETTMVLVSVGEAESMPALSTAKRPPGPVALPVIQIPWTVQRVAVVADGTAKQIELPESEPVSSD